MKLLDLHCDTISECLKYGRDLMDTKNNVCLRDLRTVDQWTQVFALFIPDEYRGSAAVEYFDRLMDCSDFLLERHKDLLFPVLNADDLTAVPKGKCGFIKAIEGGAAVAGKIENLQKVYDRGVRMITLTWNGENELGSGAASLPDKGLSDFGRQAVKEMERLGIIADASHLSQKSFWDLCEAAEKPFICTHSNSSRVCPHPRNLTDEQFKEIVRRGGLVGLNLYIDFLSSEKKGGTDEVMRHVYHMLSLGGEHILALGTDFDGAEIDLSLNSAEKLANLWEAMLKLGLKEQTAEDIFYNNAYRFLQSHL